MRIFCTVTALIALLQFVGSASAQHAHTSKYAGQETRKIKHLSPGDIAELRRGGGWGLAKAAELNGMPGPAHLLELKDKIPLNPKQIAALTQAFNTMKADAIVEGKRLIELEKQLDAKFRDNAITDAELRNMLDAISKSYRELRYIHLSAHLSTPRLLTKHQIKRYIQLRGYGDDPCAKIPEGHDPEMWKKHNNCN